MRHPAGLKLAIGLALSLSAGIAMADDKAGYTAKSCAGCHGANAEGLSDADISALASWIGGL